MSNLETPTARTPADFLRTLLTTTSRCPPSLPSLPLFTVQTPFPMSPVSRRAHLLYEYVLHMCCLNSQSVAHQVNIPSAACNPCVIPTPNAAASVNSMAELFQTVDLSTAQSCAYIPSRASDSTVDKLSAMYGAHSTEATPQSPLILTSLSLRPLRVQSSALLCKLSSDSCPSYGFFLFLMGKYKPVPALLIYY